MRDQASPYLNDLCSADASPLDGAAFENLYRNLSQSIDWALVDLNKFLVSLRQVNLERSDVTGKFHLRPPHEEIRSEIVLCELDSDFQTVRATRVDLNVDGAQAVRDAGGFEDPRLVLSPDGRV